MIDPEIITMEVPLRRISWHQSNDNQHPAEQLIQVQESLGEYGYVRRAVVQADQKIGPFQGMAPVHTDEHTYTAVAGHSVLQVLRQQDPDQWVEVVVLPSSWPEWKVLGYMMADNETARHSKRNEPQTAINLQTIMAQADQHVPTGLTGDQVAAILERARKDEDPPADNPTSEPECTKDELLFAWDVQPGDVWMAGSHLIICGSATDPLVWSAATHYYEGPFESIATSPPYADQRDYASIKAEEYVDWWLGKIQPQIVRYLADDGSLFLNLKAHAADGRRLTYDKRLVIHLVEDCGMALKDDLVWLRPGWPGKYVGRLKNAWEPIYHLFWDGRKPYDNLEALRMDQPMKVDQRGFRGSAKALSQSQGQKQWGVEIDTTQGAMPSNVLPIGNDSTGIAADDHPARWPVALPAFLMRGWGQAEHQNAWCDPFVGTGSTIVAGDGLGISVAGFDLDPWAITITLERLMRLGHDPERLGRID